MAASKPISTVIFFLLLCGPAIHAQAIGAPQCKNPAYTASQIEVVRKFVQRVDETVELVPPDEAEYIRSESRQALDQQNKARFDAVARRRYYPALEVHSDAKVILDNLDAARNGNGKDIARQLVIALSHLGNLKSSLDRFINVDMRRNEPTLNDSSRYALHYDLPSASAQTVNLLQCVISVL